MGLDMFLIKKTYVQNWEHHKPEERNEIVIKKGGKERTDIDPKRISYIVEEIGYWRKANAIHKWFVDNVQGGVDDCKEYYVSKEMLQALLADVDSVLSNVKLEDGDVRNGYTWKDGNFETILEKGRVIVNPEMAEKFLPTKSGFFFGCTDYDEGYVADLVHTKEILEKIFSEVGESDGDFYYRSSW